MLTKKTLNKWRKEALQDQKTLNQVGGKTLLTPKTLSMYFSRMLILTQELIDQLLLKED